MLASGLGFAALSRALSFTLAAPNNNDNKTMTMMMIIKTMKK